MGWGLSAWARGFFLIFMKRTAFFTLLASAALLSACATPASPADQPVQDWRQHLCENGEQIQTRHPDTETVTLQRSGQPPQTLQLAVSASGARYVGHGLEWWTKGSGPGSSASLMRHEADGRSGDLLTVCTEQAPSN